MVQQQIERQFRIGRIVLGPTRLECLAISGQRQRVDRKEHEEIILLQCGNNWPPGQFEGNRDRATEAPM